jgi:NAD(P)-dependent dehydrogenase (short-subunit alcohol dehydrogenase family)
VSGSAGREGRLAGRIALITGASRGIGRAVALRFAREGADLILAARTRAGLEEVDDEVRACGGKASLVPGDLTDFSCIDRIGGAVFERWHRLDVLVGNAAELGVLGPLAEVAPAAWERLIALNLTANWRLIRAFDPLLRASPAGRAIFVTAGSGQARAYWGPYAVSKAALQAMVKIYAAEIAKTPVRANLVDPGPTRTRLRAQAYLGEDPALVKPAEAVTDVFVALAEPGCARNGEVVAAEPQTTAVAPPHNP